MNPPPSPPAKPAAKKIPRRPAGIPKPRLKKILVPVDFSEAGKPSLHHALFLARQSGASVHLVHVMEPAYYLPDFNHAPPDLSALREQVNRELGRLQMSLFRGVKTRSEIRDGQAYLEIVSAARDLPADLIVMATHGHTGLRHIFLGSTAERVVRHAECPVLVIRSRPAAPRPKRRKTR
jgi:universal stress protein A